MDNFPQYLPTRNWRILEFWAKLLGFFVKILEFFSKPLNFFSKTLQFYKQDSLFSWKLEFYSSILSFSRNYMNLGGKFMLILVITTKLVLFFKQKKSIDGKNWVFFPTIFIPKNFGRNYVKKELADLRVFGEFAWVFS